MECTSNFSSAIKGRDEQQEESCATTNGYKFYLWLVLCDVKGVYHEERGEELKVKDESDDFEVAFLNDAMLEAGFYKMIYNY